jgi:hypothetical protein
MSRDVDRLAAGISFARMPNMTNFSDYIVYVDENGDYGLATVDPLSPLFVLACCVFEKRSYSEVVCPGLRRLKFHYFGHDMVVLYERDIRKKIGPFASFLTRKFRNGFSRTSTISWPALSIPC